MKLSAIPSADIFRAWHAIGPLIEKGLAAGLPEMSADDVFARLTRAELQAWIAYEGAELKLLCITRIETHPTGKLLVIWLLVGQGLADAGHFLADIEAWGIANGCKWVRCFARKGLKKTLIGYHPRATVFEKHL